MKEYYENARRIFLRYAEKQKEACQSLHVSEEEISKRIKNIDMKLLHTDEVITEGSNILKRLGANETVLELGKIIFLNHDIGRFPQMVLTGTYVDRNLNHFSGKDHGRLGEFVLRKGKVTAQIPNTKIYNESICDVVGWHAQGKLPLIFSKKITSFDVIKNEDMKEVFKSNDIEKKDIILSLIMQILQDVDRLDVYHQILDGRWNPLKCDEPINSKLFESFYNKEYLNMQKIREEGLWNSNVGELVRLSFVNQLKLKEVAKMIYDESIILRMKELRNNPYALDAFDNTNELLKTMVDGSEGFYLDQNIKIKK